MTMLASGWGSQRIQDEFHNLDKKLSKNTVKAVRAIEAQGKKVGLFTLKASSADYDQLTGKITFPSVLAAVKGRGMVTVAGDITETKLVQGYVTASSAGGCGPASGGCAPGACK